MTEDFTPLFEHERRFLVGDPSIVVGAEWEMITQAYIFSVDGYAVRLRRVQKQAGASLTSGTAWMTAKGPRSGAKREEYDVEVSTLFAHEVIARCVHVVRKRRYQVMIEQTWEVDEFLDLNTGLWIAELEGGEDIYHVRQPPWTSREILNEPRYNNEELAVVPFTTWR